MTIGASEIMSALALIVSVGVVYKTYLEVGSVRMAPPSMLILSFDRAGGLFTRFDPKVAVRCILVSTGERGRIIEALYMKLRYGDDEHLLPIWGVAQDGPLVTGGGLFVPRSGVVAWHHFVATGASSTLRWRAGPYRFEILARLTGRSRTTLLWAADLQVPESEQVAKADGSQQVWFTRDPATGTYLVSRESRNSQ